MPELTKEQFLKSVHVIEWEDEYIDALMRKYFPFHFDGLYFV